MNTAEMTVRHGPFAFLSQTGTCRGIKTEARVERRVENKKLFFLSVGRRVRSTLKDKDNRRNTDCDDTVEAGNGPISGN